MLKLSIASAKLTAAIVLVASFITHGPAFAQQESEWWFDVEFIAFKRDLPANQPEDFTQANYEFSASQAYDLFTLALLKQSNPLFRMTANLPKCSPIEQPPVLQAGIDLTEYQLPPLPASADEALTIAAEPLLSVQQAQELELFINQYAIWDNYVFAGPIDVFCIDHVEYNDIYKTPTNLFASYDYAADYHGLLSIEERYLSDYAKSLFRQRGIQGLLYTTWRQPVVFGEQNAEFYRVFAGEKFQSETLSPEESQALNVVDETASSELEQSDQTIEKLKAMRDAIAARQLLPVNNDEQTETQPDAIDELDNVWELDGIFKVYLEYVNRVPYLHIDSEFKHYRLSLDTQGEQQIQSFPLKQRRRIISKQVHYFDHPAFGIIIRLERFERPAEPADQEIILEADE
ncbi:hypothetical protein KJ365_02545 [Glaciecola sp. XM2]|uniref:CsiV family protein n=1 Tax=Glaciecola sp. XM2 TaxID=1914931 RepID=UPI001BDDE5F5|nr:CsiV family protein [Glaciecola sp. XM2]MBT1449744.1 hypothetical protein [Glaciecola sp. XM2]